MATKLKFQAYAATFSLALLPNIAAASFLGFLGNFDVVNDSGNTAHGFEIELEGLHSSDITDTFGGANRGFPSGTGFDPATAVVRYGAPTITEYANGSIFGTRVTYASAWDAASQSWLFGTPSGTFITPGDNCWTGGGVGYNAGTPCDHFGVGTSKTAIKTSYSWLFDDGSNSGKLTNSNGQVVLPAPNWNVIPADPAPAGQPQPKPVVAADIRAPQAEQEGQFGEAIWVKVFRTELEREVELEELIGGNPVIEQAETEIEWQLLQTDPGNPDAGKLEAGYLNVLGQNAESVIFRYEFYKYAGEYDPENHEAKVGSDSNPTEAEIGTYLGAQNGAVNLNAVAPVPVPPAVWLMGSALVGLAANRRRHSAAAAQADRI